MHNIGKMLDEGFVVTIEPDQVDATLAKFRAAAAETEASMRARLRELAVSDDRELLQAIGLFALAKAACSVAESLANGMLANQARSSSGARSH